MFQRPMLLLGVLAAAVAVPYVALNKNLSATASGQWNKLLGKGESAGSGESTGYSGALSSSTADPLSELAAHSAPVPLEQVFRFDVSPRWITEQWPRVSTVLGETNRMGLRIALVSGTQPDDVAGSLTYYFDDRHQVQRITLQGLTGDERRLVQLLAMQHGLRPAPTLGAGLYTTGDGQNGGRMQINHLPVVRSTTPNTRVEVAVDLYRPSATPAGPQQAMSAAPQLREPRRLRPW